MESLDKLRKEAEMNAGAWWTTERVAEGLADIEREISEHYAPIVRCRDCWFFFDTSLRGYRCFRWFSPIDDEYPLPSKINPDGFCAWGERRG